MNPEGKIVQFQVIPSGNENGDGIYILTDDGHLYYHDKSTHMGGWELVY